MELKIIRLQRCGVLPQLPAYQTPGSAARDLAAFLPEGGVTIAPGGRALIPTGLCMAVPEGFGGFVLARSGLAAKQGVALANGVGLIDADYRGEVKVALVNLSDTPVTIRDGDRVAQFLLLPTPHFALTLCDTLDDTQRGQGGFGSTRV